MTQGRKACRTGQRCEPRSLEEAIYCVVHHSDRDAREIAAAVGVRYGYLLDATNPDRDDTQFQSRLVVPVTDATGNPAIVEFLARAAGGVFVPLPTSTEPEHDDILRAHLAAVREFGEDAEKLEAVLCPSSDGGARITAQESREYAAEVDQTIARLVAIKLLVQQAVGNPLFSRRHPMFPFNAEPSPACVPIRRIEADASVLPKIVHERVTAERHARADGEAV